MVGKQWLVGLWGDFFFFFGLLCIFKFSYDKHVSLDLQNVTFKMKFLKRRDVQAHRGNIQQGPIHENIKCVCCVSVCCDLGFGARLPGYESWLLHLPSK